MNTLVRAAVPSARRLSLGIGFFSAVALTWFAQTPTAFAQTTSRLRTPNGGNIIVNSDKAYRDFERGVVELVGHVQVVYDNQYLSADRATIHINRQEVEAEGNLVINSPTAYVEGDKAIMNYGDNTGTIINGFVKSGQVLFEGRVVRKTGPQTYEAETAYYTACTTCPTAWSFAGSRIKAEIGGYAHIKNSVLEIANVPVLWLPYLIVPLKSERQTGFLIPSFDYSGAGGAALSSSFFWAISRSQDATFTLRNYARRGLKGLANYRYMLSDTSYGELNVGDILKDRAFANDDVFGQFVGNKSNRWFLTYDHVYELPRDFTQRTHLNFVSDLRYPRDFPEEVPGNGDSSLDNRISLWRNTEDTHASLDVDYYINQIKADPLASNEDAVHRFPELRYSLVDRPLGKSGLYFNLQTDYVNFSREDFAWDDVNGDGGAAPRTIDANRSDPTGGGVFDPNDVIRTGQRLDLQPEISYPFHVGRYVDIVPVVQFRHTQYSFNVNPPAGEDYNPTPYRQYVRGILTARTSFSRIYGQSESDANANTLQTPPRPSANLAQSWVDAESQGAPIQAPKVPDEHPTLYKHEIQPEFTLTGNPPITQSDSPFFGSGAQVPIFLLNQPISDSDFTAGRGLQFDYYDRIAIRNTASFAINNKLTQKSWRGDTPEYRQIANLRLAQSYDLDEAKRTGSGPTFPWSDLSALLDVRLNHFETNTLVQYFPYHNVTNTSSRVRFTDSLGDFFEVNFAQTYLITTRVEEAYAGRQDNVGLGAGFDTKYLTFTGGVDYDPRKYWPIDFRVKSWSTLVTLKPPGNCWGIRATFRQVIAGESTFRLDFDYKFGGEAI